MHPTVAFSPKLALDFLAASGAPPDQILLLRCNSAEKIGVDGEIEDVEAVVKTRASQHSVRPRQRTQQDQLCIRSQPQLQSC